MFLPATMAQNQLGLNNMALQFFLNQKRVEVIREWTPLGAYEIVYGKYDVKKMRVGLRERVGNEWKRPIFIVIGKCKCECLRYKRGHSFCFWYKPLVGLLKLSNKECFTLFFILLSE